MARLRLAIIVGLSVVLTAVAAACGDDGTATGTLPPIVTTTTSTTLPPTTTTIPKRYKVQNGDTLGAIARRFGLDYSELLTLNNISNPDHIFRGQNLKIPPPTTTTSTVPPSTTSTTIDAG